MQPALCFLAAVFFVSSCSPNKGPKNVYNEQYQVAPVPGVQSFETYDKEEQKLYAALQEKYTDSSLLLDFKHNRSRLYFDFFTNGQQSFRDQAFTDGYSSTTTCWLDEDTIKIYANAGFYAAEGVEIYIFKNSFRSYYAITTNGVKQLKYSLSDTGFTDDIRLNNRFQSLVLNEKPLFKTGQQLTGYLTFTSGVYFVKKANGYTDSAYVSGSAYFTGIIK